MSERMTVADLSIASGFSPKELTDLAARGVIHAIGGGGAKGKARTFAPDTERICVVAKMLIDDMRLPPSDAFRIAAALNQGQAKFGRFHLSVCDA